MKNSYHTGFKQLRMDLEWLLRHDDDWHEVVQAFIFNEEEIVDLGKKGG